MIVTVLPGFYEDIFNIEIEKDEKHPLNYLSQNYIYFTNNNNGFNRRAKILSNYDIENIFQLENIELFPKEKFPRYEYSYKEANRICKLIIDKVKEDKILLNNFEVINSFLKFNYKNFDYRDKNSVYWIYGNSIRRCGDKINVRKEEN